MANIRLSLVKDLARHLRAGHPWAFRQAFESLPRIPAGSIVDVVDHGAFVARGYFDPTSSIAVRLLTRDPTEAVDSAFFRRRVARAIALRDFALDRRATNGYRLIHGEGDGLPGVIVDRYGDYAVMKLYSAGLTPHRAALVAALRAALPELKGLIGRDELEQGSENGPGKMLFGEQAPELVPFEENGIRFYADCLQGQKTGFFLDQRDNRKLVRELAPGRTVLNCFSFSGGFSVSAALGGATRVTSVDLDADAIALCRRHFKENGLVAEDHDFYAADVLEVLKTYAAKGRTFDLVILDPPAYAKSQKAVDAALGGYANLNRTALSVLAPGGLLCTASCTARITSDEFLGTVKEAAYKAGVEMQLLHERKQPPDHPILLQFPEGQYLKFYALRRL